MSIDDLREHRRIQAEKIAEVYEDEPLRLEPSTVSDIDKRTIPLLGAIDEVLPCAIWLSSTMSRAFVVDDDAVYSIEAN